MWPLFVPSIRIWVLFVFFSKKSSFILKRYKIIHHCTYLILFMIRTLLQSNISRSLHFNTFTFLYSFFTTLFILLSCECFPNFYLCFISTYWMKVLSFYFYLRFTRSRVIEGFLGPFLSVSSIFLTKVLWLIQTGH